MTLWSPDTCECVIEYDDDLKVVAVHNKCSKHLATQDDASHFETVLGHNRKKNLVLNAAVVRLREMGVAEGAQVHVHYDDNDDLNIISDDLPPEEHDRLKGEVKQ